MTQVVRESVGSVVRVVCSVEHVLGSRPVMKSDASMAGVVRDRNAVRQLLFKP
jgi:hypothetical protein